ncbi:hypothetical protein, partial [Actinomadura logoneensis]|uniref:hypothetical protein n=1 Tax=Actinomadura logoneensis TaxID=2293572 RepID=UPI0018F22149
AEHGDRWVAGAAEPPPQQPPPPEPLPSSGPTMVPPPRGDAEARGHEPPHRPVDEPPYEPAEEPPAWPPEADRTAWDRPADDVGGTAPYQASDDVGGHASYRAADDVGGAVPYQDADDPSVRGGDRPSFRAAETASEQPVAGAGEQAGGGTREQAAGRPPHAVRRTRRRTRREQPALWWAGFTVWMLLAWFAGSWRLALLGLAGWCLYEFLLIPTVCRVMAEQGYPCREPVRGRLFACGPEHQAYKTEGVRRLLGMRRPARDARDVRDAHDGRPPSPEAGRNERGVVHSSDVRSRLAQADQVCLALAGIGTLVAVAGTLYGIAG